MTYTPPDISVTDPRGDLLSCYYNEHEYGNDCVRIHGYTQNWYESESRCTRDRNGLTSSGFFDLLHLWIRRNILRLSEG